AASLSAYLRSYVVLNLVNLSQISYAEFLEGLESPTCLAYLGMPPYDGTAVLELDITLVYSLIELLLGSKARSATTVQRSITDIEKNLIQTLLRVMLRDLSEAWKSVAEISFGVQSLASEPQLQHVLAHGQAVVVIAVEMRVGTFSGLMNLAIPSILIKRLRNKFDQVRQVRRAESSERDQQHLKRLIQEATVSIEARLNAGMISARTLLDLEAGDTLVLEQGTDSEISGLLNGREKWRGMVVSSKEKFFFTVNTQLAERPKPDASNQSA
ncbi:MAG: flagellar motor switch protein FliM, partial [Acidobacteriaceae bacterium]|nr:flagellar motor switch protein FliM [Acidobacteriaceae bacterium]